MIRKTILNFTILFSVYICEASVIFDTHQEREIDKTEFLDLIPKKAQLVLGEFHYQEKIQKAQGEIIQIVMHDRGETSTFGAFWEFLEYPKQNEIQNEFHKYVMNDVKIERLMDFLFPNNSNDKHYFYKHFIQMTKKYNGNLYSTNAPRSWKKTIIKEGIAQLDRALIPENYEIGSTHYLKRFKSAMGNHVPADKINRYFEAQSYTDSVIANSLSKYPNEDLKFLIVGSFHSDYNDGVVRELKKIMNHPTITIKLIDISDMNMNEVRELKKPHPYYGKIADFLYLIN